RRHAASSNEVYSRWGTQPSLCHQSAVRMKPYSLGGTIETSDDRSSARVANHRHARVEERQSLVVSRAGRPDREWTTNAGTTSVSCCNPRSIVPRQSATSFCDAPAVATSNWSRKSARCSLHTTAPPTTFSAFRRSAWLHVSSLDGGAATTASRVSG